MLFPVRTLPNFEIFPQIEEIPDPPHTLYYRGELPPKTHKLLCVVGSRNYSNYGKQVVASLIEGLRGTDVAIISGLALGIDALAHEAALNVNVYTLAVPGSGLDDSVLYPRRNSGLAQRILKSGGGLLSEFESTFTASTWSFPQRNRIMAGLVHAVLVIEASEKSGTLITARLAVEYNRELLVVPGSIFSDNSKGVHQFLKLGATPVTHSDDILAVLNLKRVQNEAKTPSGLSEIESETLKLLYQPQDRDTLARTLEISISEMNILLMNLEIGGYVKIDGNLVRKNNL